MSAACASLVSVSSACEQFHHWLSIDGQREHAMVLQTCSPAGIDERYSRNLGATETVPCLMVMDGSASRTSQLAASMATCQLNTALLGSLKLTHKMVLSLLCSLQSEFLLFLREHEMKQVMHLQPLDLLIQLLLVLLPLFIGSGGLITCTL